jgi:hypothetical protein
LTNTGFDIPEKIELKSNLSFDWAKMIYSDGLLQAAAYDGKFLFGDFTPFYPVIVIM